QNPNASAATQPRSANAKAPLRERMKTEQRIGAYKVLRTLGEGSFGKVKLAVHHGTGQQVALKIIARKKLISRDMAGRVEREIEYLQLLRHPHIIKLYELSPSVSPARICQLPDAFIINLCLLPGTPLSRRRPRLSWSLNMPAESSSITS